MNEDYGNTFITIVDEEGNSFEIELLDTIEFEEDTYLICLPVDIDEDDDEFGYIILRSIEVDGTELLESLDSEELEIKVYEHYMELIFEEE